ncbi:MAG: DUF262 domain-containing HNH endonuclease family protein [Dehalococcoidia bacterium]|nr:DUF262 domain-containing HNH endonuclease family protein [Dehalococcoidia bacterium]
MIDIQPQHVTLDRLLHGRLFRIPQYQRAYSWRSKERKDLFEDIDRTWAAGNDRHHFMATIVGLRREKRTIITTEHQVVEVVDGQQRITTLILILKAIAKALDRSDPVGERIGREIDETLVKQDKASLLLLQTNHDTSNYFADYLRRRTGNPPPSGSAKTLADRELLTAMEDCEKFVGDWQGRGDSLTDLVGLLKNRLTFVFYEIGDEAMVYTVFEVLNSRGLDVSWFDRLKSMLMAIVFEADTGNKSENIGVVHQLWADIYRCVGLRLGSSSEALRFAATLRLDKGWPPSRPVGEAEAAELLRDQSKTGTAKVIETTTWLKAVTEAVNQLAADRRRNAVTQIAQARLAATAVNLRRDLSEAEKERVLRRWENVTFRIYGMSDKDARWAVGNYVRLAWSITREKLPATTILAKLSDIGAEFPIAKAVQHLSKTNCYEGWQEELRYFFYRYEEYLARKAGQNFDNEQWNRIWEASAADSIEHILPQSSESADWVHWLGNLLVLPPKLNSKLGAKPPREKADEYTKTGLLVAREVGGRLPRWGRRAIEDRENALLEWALKEWVD